MNGTWSPFAGWLLHSAVGGGLLLLLAWKLMKACRQPAWRERLGEWAVLSALLLAVLSLGPSWIKLPLLGQEFASPSAVASAATLSPGLLPAPRQPTESTAILDLRTESEPGPETERDQQDLNALAIVPSSATELVAADFDSLPADTFQESPAEGFAPGFASALEPRHLSQWLTWVGVAYAVAATFFLGRWLLGHLVLWRLLQTARPAPQTIDDLFQTLNRGYRRRPRLLVSGRLRVPLSCGLLRPTVIVPSSLCEPGARRMLRWVFAHELTHVERGDAWACLLFGVGQALYFYLPWFWWLRRQVRLCQEYIADAAAAEQSADPEDYAQFLLTLTRAPAVPLGALGVLGNSSDLFRRVTMLLQSPDRVEKRCPYWWSLAAASGLLALALFASGVDLRAGAPGEAKQPAVTVANEPAETPNSDEKNQEPAPKKESKKKRSVQEVLRDLEEMLKDLPPVIDADKVKQLQDELTKAQAQVNQAIERLKTKVDAGREELHILKERLHELQSSDLALPQKEEVFRNAKKAFDQVGQLAEEINAPKLREALGRDWLHQRNEGRLGVEVQKPSPVLADQLDLPKGQGLVIERVLPDSAAAKGGLKAHDILLEFNGKPVPNDVVDFIKMLADIKASTPFDAVVLRKGRKETVKGLSLPEAKAKQPFQFNVVPGVQAVPLQPGAPVPFNLQPPNFQIQGLGGPGQRTVITTMFRTKDSFNTRHQEGSLIITVTGSVADGKSKVKQIQIQDGRKRETYESVDKVPEQYRDKVKNLIEMSEKNNLKIEIGDHQVKNAAASVAAKKKLGEEESYGRLAGNTINITLENGSAITLAEALKRILPQLSNAPITLTPFGNKLVATSGDPQVLELIRQLSRLLQTPAGEGDFEIINLKNADPSEAAKTLDAVFNDTKTKTSRIRVVVHQPSNSLLVRANPLDMLTIRRLVEMIIDLKQTPQKGN